VQIVAKGSNDRPCAKTSVQVSVNDQAAAHLRIGIDMGGESGVNGNVARLMMIEPAYPRPVVQSAQQCLPIRIE